MADTFPASCFIAARTGSRPCVACMEQRWLVVHPEGGLPVRWPYGELACDITGEERAWVALSCRRPLDEGVTVLVVRDPRVVAAVAARVDEPCRGVLEGFAAGASSRSAWQRWAVVFVLFALASVAAVGWWSCARLAPEIVTKGMPLAMEIRIGRLLAESFLAGERRIDEGPAVEAVERIVARLTAAVPNTGYAFTVHVVDDPRVNAIAFPGGHVVVFTGLLAEAASAEEVAAVLAHEFQHVLHRHGLGQLARRLGCMGVIALVTRGGGIADVARRADTFLQLAYGREEEAEADRDGLELLYRARLEVEAMASFFKRLEIRAPGDVPEFLSTHPATARRIDGLQRRAAGVGPAVSEPLDIDWERVRGSLR